jgi:hypothetical protein
MSATSGVVITVTTMFAVSSIDSSAGISASVALGITVGRCSVGVAVLVFVGSTTGVLLPASSITIGVLDGAGAASSGIDEHAAANSPSSNQTHHVFSFILFCP